MPETSQYDRARAALAVFFDAERKSQSNHVLDEMTAVALLDIIVCTHLPSDGASMLNWAGVRWLREYIDEDPGLYTAVPAISEQAVLDQHEAEGHTEATIAWCTQGLCNWENALDHNVK